MSNETDPKVNWLGTIVFEANNEHHHVLEVRKITGVLAEIVLPAEVVDEPRALRRALISQGAKLPTTKEASDSLLRGLINGDIPKLWKVPSTLGGSKAELS